ncbi:MAG: hypothetical protein OEV41_04020 [Gammaproteobacteria bacterium]|nr:hypothetical protein [Gammaproteobacteria bacterium]
MNSSLVFVLLLVSIVVAGNIVSTWLKQKKKEPALDENLDETLTKIDRLEERIRVLERIVTENRYDLKKEIDLL